MSDDETKQIPVDAPEPADSRPAYEAPSPGSDAGPAQVAEERPELVVAGAFAGAFVVAKLLQRIGRRS